jgi:hypothetical protein
MLAAAKSSNLMTIVLHTPALYLLVMQQMPNRVYYAQLADKSANDTLAVIRNVLLFGLLELGSLVVLSLALRYRIRFSAAKLLSFVLDSHRVYVQSVLVLWVFFTTQVSLEHYGTSGVTTDTVLAGTDDCFSMLRSKAPITRSGSTGFTRHRGQARASMRSEDGTRELLSSWHSEPTRSLERLASANHDTQHTHRGDTPTCTAAIRERLGRLLLLPLARPRRWDEP